MERKNIDPSTPVGEAQTQRYLQELRQRVLAEYEENKRTMESASLLDPVAALAAYLTMFRDRGLSSDTSLLPAFAIDQALEDIKAEGTLGTGGVRRVAVIGPGLGVGAIVSPSKMGLIIFRGYKGGVMKKTAVLLLAGCAMWAVPAWSQGPPAIEKSPPDTTAPDIPDVVAGGTKVQLIRDLFQSTEGPIGMPDGSLLFTEQDAGDGRLVKIDNDGNISTYLENTNRTIGLAYDPKGRLIGTQSRIPRIGVLAPTRMTLASEYGGQPLVFPNDLVIDKKGGIYFTDQVNSRFRPPPPGRTPLIFYIQPDGKLVMVSDAVGRPNGIQLSPDEKTLYAVNGPVIVAFDVQPDGTLRNPRDWATLVGLPRDDAGVVMGGADSVAIDGAGRFYASTGVGVQVFSPQGQHLGTIPTPMRPQAIAFAGPDKKTLYIVGRGAVWKVTMIAQGYLGRAK